MRPLPWAIGNGISAFTSSGIAGTFQREVDVRNGRSIVMLLVVFVWTGLLSLQVRGTPVRQTTFKVSGRLVGGPPVLRPRIGVDLFIALDGTESEIPIGVGRGIVEREAKRISLRARVKADGSFMFENVPPCTCSIRVYVSGAEQQGTAKIMVTDRDVSDLRVALVTTDVVTRRQNLEIAWSMPGPWSGVAGAPADGTIYAAAPGDSTLPPAFALVSATAHIREIDFNGKVRREIATAGFRTAKIALARFPGLPGPVFLLFNDFADGVHAVDADGKLLWTHPATAGATDVAVAGAAVVSSDAVIISYYKGVEVLDTSGKLLWESRVVDGAWHVSAGDVLGTGKPQVVTASNSGRVSIFGSDGARLRDIDPGTYATMVRVAKISPSDAAPTIFAMGARPTESMVTVAALSGTGKIEWTTKLPSKTTPPSIYSASVAPGKPWVAVGLGDGQVFVVDTGQGRIAASIDGQSLFPEVNWVTDRAGGDPRLIVSTHDSLHAFTLTAH